MTRPRRKPRPEEEENPELTNGKKENVKDEEVPSLFDNHEIHDDNRHSDEINVDEEISSDSDFKPGYTDYETNDFDYIDFENDELTEPIDLDSEEESPNSDPFPPTGNNYDKIEDDSYDQGFKYEYYKDRSYLFIFGPPAAGKTVIIGSILKYLKSYRSTKFGDTLRNINDKNIIHESEGNKLWRELTEANINNEFPSGTTNIEASKVFHNNPAPRHLNLHFSPDSSHPDFSFCIMDMAGEDLSKVDYESNAPLPSSIRTYIEDVPKQNMCFIYVLDPLCESLKKSEQTTLFEAFIENLDTNGHTSTPLLIIVSKWDTLKLEYSDIKNFLEIEYEDIYGYSHQANRDITILEYSIGEVRDNKPVRFDHTYPERLFNWLYSNQIGYDLNVTASEPEKSKFKNLLNKWKKNR